MKANTPLFFVLAAASLVHSTLAADESTAVAVTTNPALAGDGVQIGIAKRDGVTISGGEASVTRNGITEKLTKELLLPSGVAVRPDGTVTLADKNETSLRATQILTFDGKIVPLALDPNTNPGDPRGNGDSTIAAGSLRSGSPAGGSVGNTIGTSRSMPRASTAANGSVFLGSDGVPFMGTLNPDGTILRADGTLLRADGSYRSVSFGPDGTPALGTVNNNGTVTRSDGSIVSPDGSTRSANGTMVSAATQSGVGTANNGNTNPGVPQQTTNGSTQTNNGVTSGGNSNSTGNSGAMNNGSMNRGTTQQGTSQQGTSQQGSNSNNTTGGGTRGSNGASGGAVSGGGASGAGGASGGSAGGASR